MADADPRLFEDRGGTAIVVMPSEEGLRIDVVLAGATRLSRRAVRRLVSGGGLSRNGSALKVLSRTVRAGDVLRLAAPPSELAPDRPLEVPHPTILFEDRWLVAADKPAGVLAQPAERSDPEELAFDQILLLALARRDGRRPFLRLLHRLDRLTSGVVLAARAREALRPVARAWREGRVDRRYLAVVEGRPGREETLIDRPIARDPGHAWRFVVADRGRAAQTVVRLLDHHHDFSTVECRLVTGRTHQVRVHLAAIGHPVVGDRLYGSARSDLARRPLLHALSLGLPHPEDGRTLEIVSSPPEDVLVLVGDPLAARLRAGIPETLEMSQFSDRCRAERNPDV
jgi:RluA family pseudouridine synthase